jgi:hypothetical protein
MAVPMPRRAPARRIGAASAIAAALIALAAARTAPLKEEGGFIVTLGRDTIAAETFAIQDDGTLTGVSAVRRDRATVVRYYTLTLDAAGDLVKYEMASFPPGSGPGQRPSLHTIWTPVAGGIREVIHTKEASELQLATPRNTLPFMDLGFGMWQAVTMRLMRSGRDSIVVPMFFVDDTTHYTTVAKRLGPDSVVLTSIYGVGRAKVDARGLILGYAAPGSTQQVIVTREPNVDVKAMAAAFAAQPPLGQLSPPDTVRATVGGAKVWIAYSRPKMRGRVIFGGVVPWNVWWRTGANAATTMVTDQDLVIGGVTVPAGEYTLFTLPGPTAWKLIISKQTKEWGTDYDPAMDLARVDMTVAALTAPVEEMTIAIVPRGAGALLTVMWDRTAASVEMRSK